MTEDPRRTRSQEIYSSYILACNFIESGHPSGDAELDKIASIARVDRNIFDGLEASVSEGLYREAADFSAVSDSIDKDRDKTFWIRFRQSGGRGEYEVSNCQGFSFEEIQNRRIILRLDDRECPTHVTPKKVDGKPRLRLDNGNDRKNQSHLSSILARYLLLPNPTRTVTHLDGMHPILRDDQYILEVRLALRSIGRSSIIAEPVSVTARLKSLNDISRSKFISVKKRREDIKYLASDRAVTISRGRLPNDIKLAVIRFLEVDLDIDYYRNILEPMTELRQRIITEFGQYIDPEQDPVQPLLELCNHRKPDAADVLESITPSPDIESRIRAENLRRLTVQRGPAARKFARDVALAYDYTCAFCGFASRPIDGAGARGVQSAHILPWSIYVLDTVANGLCLCNLHHWAFDNRLLKLDYGDGHFSVSQGPAFHQFCEKNPESERTLSACLGRIPDERFPQGTSMPNPKYIDRFNTDAE